MHTWMLFPGILPGSQTADLETWEMQPAEPWISCLITCCKYVQRGADIKSLPRKMESYGELLCTSSLSWAIAWQPAMAAADCGVRRWLAMAAADITPAEEDHACFLVALFAQYLLFAHLQAEKEAREGQIAKLTARIQEMELAQGHLAERNRLLETCLMINSPGSEQVCFCTA